MNHRQYVYSLTISLYFLRWSATFSADCPELKPGIGALASSRDTAFGTVVTFTCPIGQEFATGKSKIVTECLVSYSVFKSCQDTSTCECNYKRVNNSSNNFPMAAKHDENEKIVKKELKI